MTEVDLTALVSDDDLARVKDAVDRRVVARTRRRRIRHRLVAAGALLGAAALVTAGALVLTPPAPPPPLSEAEKWVHYRIELERSWVALLGLVPEAERPDVEFERFISRDEWPQATVECLAEMGIPAKVGYDDGVETSGDFEESMVGLYVCGARFPVDPSDRQPLSDDEVLYVYRYYTEVLASCIRSLGIAPADAPTLDEFRRLIDGDRYWTPMDAVGSREDHVAIYESCEVTPPGLRP